MNRMWSNLCKALEQQGAMLMSILHSQGSAPRHAGAQMVLLEDGGQWGTIGGGKIEAVCLVHAAKLLAEKQSDTQTYNLSDAGENSIGMSCGGKVTVEFRYLPMGNQSVEWVTQMVEKLPVGRVLIFGAGHVSQALAALLPALELDYIVVDDRPEFAKEELFPAARQVLCCPMQGAVEKLSPKPEDLMVVVTRGHAHDYEVVCQALNSPVEYIGLMGSRRKVALMQKRWLEDGFTTQQLERISTPIGLDIGAETPAEIAISIAAQLIQVQAQRRPKGGWAKHLIHS